VNDPSRPLSGLTEYEQDLIWVKLVDLVMDALKTAEEWHNEALIHAHYCSSNQPQNYEKALSAIERAVALEPKNIPLSLDTGWNPLSSQPC
jgi:hypothetical protein